MDVVLKEEQELENKRASVKQRFYYTNLLIITKIKNILVGEVYKGVKKQKIVIHLFFAMINQ